MKTLQYFTEGLLNKDNKTKAMSMVDVFLGGLHRGRSIISMGCI